MKVYSYFVCQVWNEEKESYEMKKLKCSNEVIEHPGIYEQADDNKFYTSWTSSFKNNTNYLCKSSIGEVTRHVYGTSVIYGTYLTEDDEKKAFDIIANECKKDIEELQRKLEEQTSIYNLICSGEVLER